MKRVRAFVLTAALWLSSCVAVIAAPVDDAKRECAAETFALAHSVLYAKNVLNWSEAEVVKSIEADALVRDDALAFVAATFRGDTDGAQQAIKRVYDRCVAVRSSYGVGT